MQRAYFITGTDTGVGKTSVAVALLQAATKCGLSTAAVKPVAAGCEMTDEGLRNDDALYLQQACSTALSYAQINPFALQPPIAPHFAAARQGLHLDAQQLATHCQSVLDLKADLTLIEGAGGWRVPLNESESFADMAKLLAVPVILVVDIKLGCLNHALLSAEGIRADGLLLAGWVANQASGVNECHAEMVADLQGRLACPLLADLPHRLNQNELAADFDLSVLQAT
ncbi:MAG: dethiobiotin synthase [Gammaproteobacteria bacterium]|nr:dethiobiotin synthase [Gammaproteobacteria bacterium]MBQ0839913.1 dethiobiotin synthase [Gammaproteobacteria bacterium]